MGLRDYHKKRDFKRTAEPAGRAKKAPARSRRKLRFVVQKHDASRLHYDFRLEMEGVLRSWAVPKGPSLDPRERRLAVEVEDHPLDYGSFEGTIPKGEYGGGTVLLWDRGTWLPEGDPVAGWKKGHLEFELEGEKLRGRWNLVRLRDREGRDGRANWLLIKRSDDEARPLGKGDILADRPESVATGRDLPDIAAGKRGPGAKKAPTRNAGDSHAEGAEVAGVVISHPDRLLWPKTGVTKLALARYYEVIADRILAHVADRPLLLLRCPQGEGHTCFVQRHITGALPHGVHGIEASNGSAASRGLLVKTAEGLVALVQLGVMEFHVWGARARDLERPDRLIFDLDPGPRVAWDRVVAAAHLLRETLEELGLESFAKTTGGKGLHVTVPLRPRATWADVEPFCRGVAEAIVAGDPARFVAQSSKAKRTGRIFIDYLRNARGASAVAPWSTRARPGAPVATPLAWKEITPELDPSAFDVPATLQRLLRTRRDPWPGFATSRQTLGAAQLKTAGRRRA